MTIEQIDIVDFIGTDKEGNICLTISDHLEWDKELEHIYALQEKINKYLAFIESGEIKEHYENVDKKNIIISLICKYEPNVEAQEFLVKSKTVIEEAGFNFNWKLFDEK